MAENDVDYGSSNNIDCFIEKDGKKERANLVVSIPGPGAIQPIKKIDSDSTVFEFLMEKELNDVTVVGDLTKDQYDVTFSAGHGFVVGDFWTFYWSGPIVAREQVNQIEVIAVNGNVITLGTPIGEDITNATIRKSKRVTCDMAVNGSIARDMFGFAPPQGLTWLVTRIISTMLLSSQPDDGLFGDITKLNKGVVFGVNSPFIAQRLGGFRENGDFRATAYDVDYVVRSGGQGTWGLAFRKSFNGDDKYGAPIPISDDIGSYFQVIVQDDLTAIEQFRLKIMGKQKEDF